MPVPGNTYRGTVRSAGRGCAGKRGGRERPVHCAPKYPSILIDPGTATTNWAALGGSNALTTDSSITNPEGNAVAYVHGTGTAANTNSFWKFVKPVAGNNAGWQGIEFDIYVNETTYAIRSNNGFYLTCTFRDAGTTNTVAATIQVGMGWQRVRLSKADFSTVVGGGNWDTTTFADLTFKIAALPSYTNSYWIRNLSWYTTGSDKVPCVIVHDDIGIGVYNNAFPLAKARGIPLTNAVISDGIGQSAWNGYDRCSAAQLLEMNNAGGCCVNHTKSHQQNVLPTDTQANCYTEISTCSAAIRSNRLSANGSDKIFCPPYGEFGTNYWAAAVQDGCTLWRGLGATDTTLAHWGGGTRILVGPRYVRCLWTINTTTTAAIMAFVDSAISEGAPIIIAYHHILAASTTSIERTTALYTADLDALVTRAASLEFINLAQLAERCLA